MKRDQLFGNVLTPNVSFEAPSTAFFDRLDLFSNLANIGDAKSLVIHPASTTHQRMSIEALEEAGISEGLIRLSIGIESVDDLIEDLEKGFRTAAKALKK